MTAMGYEALELHIANGVAKIRLTRPEVFKRFRFDAPLRLRRGPQSDQR